MPTSSRPPLDYKTLRATHKEIIDQILDILSTQTLDLCAQRLGFWERGRPSIRHPLEAALVCDFALHDDRDPEDDRTPIERARDLAKPGSVARDMLSVMASAQVDVWRVETVQPSKRHSPPFVAALRRRTNNHRPRLKPKRPTRRCFCYSPPPFFRHDDHVWRCIAHPHHHGRAHGVGADYENRRRFCRGIGRA